MGKRTRRICAPALTVPIEDQSSIGAARRRAAGLATEVGMDEAALGRLALVVTELGTNIWRHASEGQILLQCCGDTGVEVIAMDHGPGIPNLSQALKDGFSTAGSQGGGLGSIIRQSDRHEVYTQLGAGTVIWALVDTRPKLPPEEIEVGAIVTGKRGSTISGDSWAVRQWSGGASVVVMDGLGHGVRAQEAAEAGIAGFLSVPPDSGAEEVFGAMDAALRRTRGAVAAHARIDLDRDEMVYASVGNIEARLLGPIEGRRLPADNGTLGLRPGRVRSETYPWERRSMLILHSDGLTGRWATDAYPGITYRHPGVVAGLLYRDAARGTDDAVVVALRQTPEREERVDA